MRHVNRTVLALVLVLAAAACSGSVSIGGLDVEALEEAIVELGDAQAVEGAPWAADCDGAPSNPQEGDTFQCTATADDGTEIGVTVTATDDDGNFDVNYDF